ncbi:hypothetical protein [Roseibium sp.]|uniref:hypothetical protein n=1 Tax=Roseibium sp. TaxID=1936156 RepID=UPI0039189795
MARMATNQPTRKVVATSLAGALATVLIWVLNDYFNIPIPEGVNAAIVTLISFVIGWYTPPSIHDQVINTTEQKT